jgi:AcrR family transcriptional regulator
MPTDASPGRRRASPGDSKRAERRREEIIAASIRLFSERGYRATSTKDIGEEIGLLAGSLYYHIRSKEDLLYDIMLELHTSALEETRAIEAEGGDPIERLRRLVGLHVVAYDEPRIRLFEAEAHHLGADRRKAILLLRRRYTTYVISLIEQAQRSGLCDPQLSATAIATAILGLLNSMPRWFHPDGQASIDEMADTIDRLVLGGLHVSSR